LRRYIEERLTKWSRENYSKNRKKRIDWRTEGKELKSIKNMLDKISNPRTKKAVVMRIKNKNMLSRKKNKLRKMKAVWNIPSWEKSESISFYKVNHVGKLFKLWKCHCRKNYRKGSVMDTFSMCSTFQKSVNPLKIKLFLMV